MRIFKCIFLSFFSLYSLPSAAAGEVNEAGAAKMATDFIRVDQVENATQLQTAVTRYQKDGTTVDLIGAIHIADDRYFKKLNEEFKAYETVLFEMVGGERMKNGKMEKPTDQELKGQDPMLKVLGNLYEVVSKFLQLQSQKDGINYAAKNFVHADLTLEEFQKAQQEKGESVIGFALQNARQANNDKAEGKPAAPQPDSKKLMMALLRGDANMVKREIVGTLGQGDDQVAAFAGNSVIIGDRNIKCLEVLDSQIQKGHQKIGIFYGAAHFPDMEQRMLKDGYKKTNQRWVTAWHIPVEKPLIQGVPAEKK